MATKTPRKVQKKTDIQKFVEAVDNGDNVTARKILEKSLKAKAFAKIKSTLEN